MGGREEEGDEGMQWEGRLKEEEEEREGGGERGRVDAMGW